ncbi:c-type cytochrome [Alcanivorax quisquiliarum]|uniref:C-type cytochrome n=1 Tax=Alcanivorax quisquiliarum TaxID=2933565 RepID=A0ABT0E4N9_9GAMM|nr:c-type cytochrome [Alcanivorax quisquiliarum]MCK0536776.1 c-type cytochrome [Alcanivorax quisquiliarum]
MKKMLALSALLLAGVAGADIETRYNQSCVFCHGTGAAGAPVTGDKAAWAPRLEKGMDELVQSTRQGLGGMPPGGMCGDCSDEEYRALIEYMTK